MCQINLNQTNILAVQTLEINDQLADTVNAEELHQFLEVKTPFDKWISRRIEALGLEENQDFIIFRQKCRKVLGRPKTEFYLTLEAAKHISMAERNQKGREARKYFISVESKAKTLVPQLQQQNKQLLDLFLQQNPMYSKIVRYSQLGLNATEVAKLCDMSTTTLLTHRKKLAELNLIDPPQAVCTLKHNFTLAEIDHMIELYNQGLSFTAIGKQFKCSYKTVKRRINEVKHALNRNKTAHMA